jgi:hypothetical protein
MWSAEVINEVAFWFLEARLLGSKFSRVTTHFSSRRLSAWELGPHRTPFVDFEPLNVATPERYIGCALPYFSVFHPATQTRCLAFSEKKIA